MFIWLGIVKKEHNPGAFGFPSRSNQIVALASFACLDAGKVDGITFELFRMARNAEDKK